MGIHRTTLIAIGTGLALLAANPTRTDAASPSTAPTSMPAIAVIEPPRPAVEVPPDPVYAAVFKLWADGSQRNAERALRELVPMNPENVRLAFFDAICDYTRYGGTSGLTQFRQVAAMAPQSPEGRCAIIILNIKSKADEPAQTVALERLAQEHSTDPLIRWLLARHYRELSRDKECAALCEKLSGELNPGPAQIQQMWANALDVLNRHEDALVHRKMALSLEEGAWSNSDVAYTLNLLRRYDEANDYCAKAVAIYPAAEHWWRWGLNLTDAQRYEEAIEKVKRATEANPRLWRPWNVWGLCLHRLGQIDEALEKYQKAREVAPQEPVPYRNAILLLRTIGRAPEATKIEEEWKQANGSKPLEP
jgi:tetratricopeptide (TPR) repeat protein